MEFEVLFLLDVVSNFVTIGKETEIAQKNCHATGARKNIRLKLQMCLSHVLG
jgi:hypothetical protein